MAEKTADVLVVEAGPIGLTMACKPARHKLRWHRCSHYDAHRTAIGAGEAAVRVNR
jgi:hypothetical protein